MKPKILYVGDSVVRLNSIKAVLEDQGYDIWTAREVEDGLRILSSLDFEAMMVEQHLMGVNQEQLSRIREVSPKLPVLSVSEGVGDDRAEIDRALRGLERIMQRETSSV